MFAFIQVNAGIPEDALTRSIQYLETELPSMTDPYEIAITSYALSLAKSPQATVAMDKLQSLATVEGNTIVCEPNAEYRHNSEAKELKRLSKHV